MKSGFFLNIVFFAAFAAQSSGADGQADAIAKLSQSRMSDAICFLKDRNEKNNVHGEQRVDFERYHFAPNIAQATRSKGHTTFNRPNRSLLCIVELKSFAGMVDNSPTFTSVPGQYGEYREVDGERILEFDRTNKICRVRSLPDESAFALHPLPLIFTQSESDASERFHLQKIDLPAGVVVIEGFPKQSYDKSQFSFFRACFDEDSYELLSLIVYAPRFHPLRNPVYDHYTVEPASPEGAHRITSRPIDPNMPPPDWRVVNETLIDK